MKRWAIILLALVGVGVIIGLAIGGAMDQAERVRLLVAGCVMLVILLAFLVVWVNRER